MTKLVQGSSVIQDEFHRRIAAFIANKSTDPSETVAFPENDPTIGVSLAYGCKAKDWATYLMPWSVFRRLLSLAAPDLFKDSAMVFPGLLSGPRKIQSNVTRLDLAIYDYDKGDAPPEALIARMQELGITCLLYTTYSHGKHLSDVAWSITRRDHKSGTLVTSPAPLQSFARDRLRLSQEVGLDPADIPPDIIKDFFVERLGYHRDVIGEVTLGAIDHGTFSEVDEPGAKKLTFHHRPIAKTRLIILLAEPFERLTAESNRDFQNRWQNELYLPLGTQIGFDFDRACATLERGHYAISRRVDALQPHKVMSHNGAAFDWRSEDFKTFSQQRSDHPHAHNNGKQTHADCHQARQQRATISSSDWRGFQAADAIADKFSNVTDKRTDSNNPLVAFPCPFVASHTTTNDPTARQCYAYNAGAADKLPTIKCLSATCQNRPYDEFLDALFDDDIKGNPQYRRLQQLAATGVYIHLDQLPAKLIEINDKWALVRVGNRTRYLHESAEGDIELYDGKSASDWFSNWVYYWTDKRGQLHEALIFPEWKKWQHRRQYRGMRFCPQPEGAPEGIFNSYYGFAVEPKKGCWKRLLAHIYRNICRRNPNYCRFLVAWIAQLLQQPHVKPGTNIVLRGKEGVGKSKLAEWLAELFGRNAIIVSEAERITGRFNGHLENKLLLIAEEAFWAGDKAAEGKLKDLATGTKCSYERKGLDGYEGNNYTRIIIASNEDWVVPASSGGRRWFVLEVGDEHEKDYAYFKAIDDEMSNGGLAAMLYDLLKSTLPQTVNVRSAPVTPWLVEQRLHSYDNKKRWWRGVVAEGGFRDNETGTFVRLTEHRPTVVSREHIFASAKQYFKGPKGVDPSPSEIGHFIAKTLGELPATRPRTNGRRQWCTVFPSLEDIRSKWLADTGETIASPIDAERQTDQSDGYASLPRPGPGSNGFGFYAAERELIEIGEADNFPDELDAPQSSNVVCLDEHPIRATRAVKQRAKT